LFDLSFLKIIVEKQENVYIVVISDWYSISETASEYAYNDRTRERFGE